MRIRTVAVILAALVFNYGCAFSIHETQLDYDYAGEVAAVPHASGVGINVATIEDARAVDDPRVISHLVNGYGQTTSGGYFAEEPITDIVKKGIKQALSAAGYAETGSDLDLDANIEEYEYDAVAGFWSAKKITSRLTLSIKLSRNGNIVTRNTLIGRSTLLPPDFKGKQDKELVVILFTNALNDVLTQVVEVVNGQTT